MAVSGSKRVANRLVALGSAAVLTVYAAGFVRTRAAAQKLAGDEGRRRVAPAPADAGGVASPAFIEPPATTREVASQPPAKSPKSDLARATPRLELKAASKPAPPVAAEPPADSAPPVDAVEPPVVTAEAAPPPPAPKPVNLYKDGTFSGWGTSRHGDIQAAVVIEDGRIISASITQCLTRYSCSWIAHLPPQVVGRQSAEVDYVSGATQSSNAFYYAIVEALSKAK